MSMSANKDLATRCVLTWFELTPEMAREWFTEDAIYENKCDQGPTVVGPDEIYAILDAYRQMCERFEGTVVNIAEEGDVVMLEREELTFLKNGGVVNLPVMASFSMRDGKIAAWREYWDLAILTRHLLEGESGEAVTERYEGYQAEAAKRGAAR
jgi:limonene-1,2-epoxide hydrolase